MLCSSSILMYLKHCRLKPCQNLTFLWFLREDNWAPPEANLNTKTQVHMADLRIALRKHHIEKHKRKTRQLRQPILGGNIKPIITAGNWHSFPSTSNLSYERTMQTSEARKGKEVHVPASGSQAGMQSSGKDAGIQEEQLLVPNVKAQGVLSMWTALLGVKIFSYQPP